MQLQNGRPTDTTGRLDKEIRTYDFLDKLGIEYQRIDHEAAFTMEVCEEIDKTLGATICKSAGYGKISGYHTGLSQCDGADERP